MRNEMNLGSFNELAEDEMMCIDGGFGVTITAALIGLGATCFIGGFAAGVTIGLNRKNRK